ncbi:MAG: histidine kinase [Flavobacteriales bacterium]|nr:histidine kinase [Flavobacteriales bacterium]
MSTIAKDISVAKTRRHLMFHIIFWVCFIVISLPATKEFFAIDNIVMRTIVAALTVAVLVYTNYLVLLPKFFLKKKYLEYIGLLIMLVLLITALRVEIDAVFVKDDTDSFLKIRSWNHYSTAMISNLLVALATSSFKFLKGAYDKERVQQELKNYKLQAELRFLKAQVNPHFLFNSLNNIYALSVSQSPKTPEMIMKLSSLMRHMLYESKGASAPINQEIEYMNSYIDLQQLRTRYEQNVTFEIIGDLSGVEIPPLVFIPLLENAFKHGNISKTEEGWIKMVLEIRPKNISFRIDNSVDTSDESKDRIGGIGLNNIKQRLNILCGNQQSTFWTKKKKDTFTAFLKFKRNWKSDA